MKTVNKVSIGLLACTVFLGLAAFGLNVKIETTPESASAATVDMMRVFVAGTVNTNGADVQAITITQGQSVTINWRAPDGYSYCNTGVSPNMPAGWGSYVDKAVSGTLTITPTQDMRFQLQCAISAPGPMVIEDGVGVNVVAATTTTTTYQCSDNLDNDGDGAMDYPSDFSCSSATDTDETNPKAQCQDGLDNDGDNLTDYPQDPGCFSKQDNNESNATGNIMCTTASDCGSNGYTGSQTCGGNSIYQNYTTWSCLNAGTTSSSCVQNVTNQQKFTCSNNQTCNNGSCVNNQTTCTSNHYQQCVGNSKFWYDSCGNQGSYIGTCGSVQTCTANSYQSCVGNSKYWYDSCGNQGSYVGTCGTVSTCTTHSYYRCSGSGVYWFNSCGQQEGLYQACTGNQTCPAGGTMCVNQNINYGNLTVNVQVRNLSSGNLNWSPSVIAAPGDIAQLSVTIQAANNNYANNIILKDILPSNLYFYNNVMVDGVSNSGNIVTGINIGSLTAGQTRTVTYQVQVAGSQNFTFGTTTLTNSVTATSSDNNYGTGHSSIVVTRSGILGVTTVSTGLTNNPFVDSFFLPLVLALLGVWAWKAGLFHNVAIAGWFNAKKAAKTENTLQSKISAIKEKEIV